MDQKILFVDDDANLLAALKRRLRKQYKLKLAEGPEAGLLAIEEDGPFAVVVADMRMPGMDGIEFLAKVKIMSPDTVRIMLTGNADMQTAIDAVNKGSIFRFLTKPTPNELLTSVLEDALNQHRLIHAEKELLEKTLMGSIKVMSEILSLVNPLAFSRSSRVRRYVRHIAVQMKLDNWWRFELAAMLSQIGCVTLPAELLEKYYAQSILSPDEEAMIGAHPAVARDLLAHIPRLEPIAGMIATQQKPFSAYPPIYDMPQETRDIAVGGQILKAALDFDQLILNGLSQIDALTVMRSRGDIYNYRILNVLETLTAEHPGDIIKSVLISQLNTQMIADEDIKASNGLLLVSKGQEITYPVMERLRNFSRRIQVHEPVRVRIPQGGN